MERSEWTGALGTMTNSAPGKQGPRAPNHLNQQINNRVPKQSLVNNGRHTCNLSSKCNVLSVNVLDGFLTALLRFCGGTRRSVYGFWDPNGHRRVPRSRQDRQLHCVISVLCVEGVKTGAAGKGSDPLPFAPFRTPFGRRRRVDSNAPARDTTRYSFGKVIPLPAPGSTCRPDQVVAGSRPSPTRFPLEYPRSRRP